MTTDLTLRNKLEVALGGTYALGDRDPFWMDAACVREIIRRLEGVVEIRAPRLTKERADRNAEFARLREAIASANRVLVKCFNRIHGLPRTTDDALAREIGEWRRDYIDAPARAALSPAKEPAAAACEHKSSRLKFSVIGGCTFQCFECDDCGAALSAAAETGVGK